MLDILGININNINIAEKATYKSIIDTGSTLTYFPNKLYSNLKQTLTSHCNNNPKCYKFDIFDSQEETLCFKLYDDNEQVDIVNEDVFYSYFPNIDFQIQKVQNKGKLDKDSVVDITNIGVFKWYPSNYFYRVERNVYCVGVIKGK